jgi:hypothetical protein
LSRIYIERKWQVLSGFARLPPYDFESRTAIAS